MHCTNDNALSLSHFESEAPAAVSVGVMNTDVLTADRNRVAVVLSAAFPAASGVDAQVRVGVMDGANLRPLAVLTLGQPTVILHRSAVGERITETLVAIATAAGFTVHACGTRLRPRSS